MSGVSESLECPHPAEGQHNAALDRLQIRLMSASWRTGSRTHHRAFEVGLHSSQFVTGARATGATVVVPRSLLHADHKHNFEPTKFLNKSTKRPPSGGLFVFQDRHVRLASRNKAAASVELVLVLFPDDLHSLAISFGGPSRIKARTRSNRRPRPPTPWRGFLKRLLAHPAMAAVKLPRFHPRPLSVTVAETLPGRRTFTSA
jgi:hypothetical protein